MQMLNNLELILFIDFLRVYFLTSYQQLFSIRVTDMAAVYITTDVSSCQLKFLTVKEFSDNIKQLHINHNAWYQ